VFDEKGDCGRGGRAYSGGGAVAAAEPVKFSGDVAAKYQRVTADGEPSVAGSVYTLKLLGEAGLGGGWSLYARLGAQSVTNPLLADFNIAPEVTARTKSRWQPSISSG
jgi:hypothetical protein